MTIPGNARRAALLPVRVDVCAYAADAEAEQYRKPVELWANHGAFWELVLVVWVAQEEGAEYTRGACFVLPTFARWPARDREAWSYLLEKLPRRGASEEQLREVVEAARAQFDVIDWHLRHLCLKCGGPHKWREAKALADAKSAMMKQADM